MQDKTRWLVDEYTQNSYIQSVISFLNNIDNFSKFRIHPAYNSIVPDCMPQYQIDTYSNIIKSDPELMSKFDIIKLMDKIGSPEINPKLSTANRNLKYMYATKLIKQYFKNISKVVEIGVGYGGLCFTLCQYFDIIGYKLLDITYVVELARLFLSKLPPINHSIDIEEFFNPQPPYDLLVSECALSELDDESIQYYYDNYLQYSRQLFIRTNFEFQNRSFKLPEFVKLLQKDFTLAFERDLPHESEPFTLVVGYHK